MQLSLGYVFLITTLPSRPHSCLWKTNLVHFSLKGNELLAQSGSRFNFVPRSFFIDSFHFNQKWKGLLPLKWTHLPGILPTLIFVQFDFLPALPVKFFSLKEAELTAVVAIPQNSPRKVLGEPIQRLGEKKRTETKLLVLVYAAVGSWEYLPEESGMTPQHDAMLTLLLASQRKGHNSQFVSSITDWKLSNCLGWVWLIGRCGEGPVSALGWVWLAWRMTSQGSGLNVIGKEKTQSVFNPRTGLAASMVILTARVDDQSASKAFCCPDCADPSLGFAFIAFRLLLWPLKGNHKDAAAPPVFMGRPLLCSGVPTFLLDFPSSYLSRSPDSPKLSVCFFPFPSITLLRSDCIVNVTYITVYVKVWRMHLLREIISSIKTVTANVSLTLKVSRHPR